MKIQIAGDVPKYLMEEMQKDKPSEDASYWAKGSCKNCYGRGVIGKVTVKDKSNNVFSHEQLCICARKSYKKWQDNWLEARKSVKIDNQDSVV